MIENHFILLRPLSILDAPHFYALNEDPEVLWYVPDEPFVDEAAARAFLSCYFASQPKGYGRMAVIRKSDQAWLGWCGLKYHADTGLVDLGYRFFRRYWGRGYATQAARLSIKYGFETLGVERIVGRVAPENAGSIRVLEKCGFSLVGEHWEKNWRALAYELSRSEWGVQNLA